MSENVISVNGFNSEEISILYQFLVDYETVYKGLNATEFNKRYPQFMQLKELLDLSKTGKAKMVKDSIPEHEENHVLMTEGKQPSHFLKHLRNAFAHSQLIKNEHSIGIIDFPKEERPKKEKKTKKKKKENGKNKGHKYYSAYGTISAETFAEILKLLSNN